MTLKFTKMHGCGNDYMYLDCRESGVPENIEALCLKLSPRHIAVGADGIICICAPETEGADATMRMFNADGSEGKMCGNGIRCVAHWLVTHVPAMADRQQLRIDTRSGCKLLTRRGENIWQVAMGEYRTDAPSLPAVNFPDGPLVNVPLQAAGKSWQVTCISVGNPHCVTVVPDVRGMNLEAIGPQFENHPNFPERVNTEFIQVVDSTHLIMRVWERGSGETWACGTGTSAAVAAMVELGICPAETDISVQLLGGTLQINIGKDRGILLTGPAEVVYEAEAQV